MVILSRHAGGVSFAPPATAESTVAGALDRSGGDGEVSSSVADDDESVGCGTAVEQQSARTKQHRAEENLADERQDATVMKAAHDLRRPVMNRRAYDALFIHLGATYIPIYT